MSGFDLLNLSPELQFTLSELGHQQPTPIQQLAIPLILQGVDVMAQAQTGTGKTAAFALPMIEMLSKKVADPDYHAIRGLILTPTRELAIQVGDSTLAYGRRLGMRVASIYGGVRFDNQIRKMKRGADILVATPGRLLDMLAQNKLSINQLEILVFDEADRMLDLGFIDDIRKLMRYMPSKRQTLLFSATFSSEIDVLAEHLLNSPHRVNASPPNSVVKLIKQRAFAVDQKDKSDILSYFIKGLQWTQVLVFTRTRQRADSVAEYLQSENIKASALHGEKIQRERNMALQQFADGEINVLVATDVAARGLDIDSLSQVVNYDIPNQAEAYVHRIGRTGRAGKSGVAYSFVAPDERVYLSKICELIQKNIPLEPVPIIESGKMQGARSETKTVSKKTKGRPVQSKPKRPAAKAPTPAISSQKDVKTNSRDKARRSSLFDKP
ncbi:DEAD/DEAH box helicase [Nitrincola nitratireducens]|uniref:ATP-dependent RNA helicase rhlE n=1 Tax=Nitrincola nitratireducens TaxID=1229521 RepID=W9VN41_9GAMM|nr:DEAD/DEAH box helicase [Nitrincola nitratireducens]EXJ11915.1 ATP-dependent RNA helicase rhlE [Nitrincola nitratireducens]